MSRFINLTGEALRIRAQDGSFVDILPSTLVVTVDTTIEGDHRIIGLIDLAYNKEKLYIVDKTVSDVIVDKLSVVDFDMARSLMFPFFIPGNPIYKGKKFIGYDGLRHPDVSSGCIKHTDDGPLIVIRGINTNELEN